MVCISLNMGVRNDSVTVQLNLSSDIQVGKHPICQTLTIMNPLFIVSFSSISLIKMTRLAVVK